MERSRRRGIGRTEVLIGAAVVGVLGLIAIPLFLSVGKGSAREEVPLLVESIRKFEFLHHEPFGEYVSAAPAPREPHLVDGHAVPWVTNAGFTKLGWEPGVEGLTEVYGSYHVSATEDGFKVTGTCDVDGDGERATFEATADKEAAAVSASNVY